MLASEYIVELQKLIDTHGDHQIVNVHDNQALLPEFVPADPDIAGQLDAFVLDT